MCGLAGIASAAGAPPPSEQALARMIATLHHRGPDGSRIRCDGQVGLAHARLSIVDLDGGWQPMANHDGSTWVVFNGEIFNHLELRGQLEREGCRFRTVCDTEVIVHLYDRYGDRFVDHLNGQFAIALHDTRRQRMVFARDRVGIRPFYYSCDGRRFVFGSEVKALFALPDAHRAIDLRGLGQVFSAWGALAPDTVFEGVRQLEPGHLMILDLRAPVLEPVSAAYWDWEFFEDTGSRRSEDDYAEELRALLMDAVRLQMRADVPVGAYLSGGLDSSAIAALVAHCGGVATRTFSLGFDTPEFDERSHQRAMVRALGTEHSEIVISGPDIADGFAHAVRHAESPLLRTGPVPMSLLASHAHRAGYKVVLTGEGADEVFAGYDLFKEAKVRRFMARQPGSRWRGRLVERLYPYLAHSPARSRGFSAQFFGEGREELEEPWFAHGPRIRSTQRAWRFFSPQVREQFGPPGARFLLQPRLPPSTVSMGDLARDQYVEAKTLLPGYLLSSQGDRMSMAHSVEARYPFLDHRLVEFGNRLPARYKLRGLSEKYLLKRAIRGDVPHSIISRHKQPYRSPDSSSFFRDGAPLPWVADALDPSRLRACGLFDVDGVTRLAAKCRAGRAIGFPDNMAFVGVLSTLLLHEQFVQTAGGS